MNKILKKIMGSVILVFFISSMWGGTIQATQEKIEDVKNKIDELEDKKDEAEKEMENSSNSANNLQGDLKEFNTSLSNITEELNQTEEKLKKTQEELKKTKKILAEAKEQEQHQYEAMKKRIQFMYEMSTESMVEILMESESMVDFLNRSEYIVNIYEYDRNMLNKYREIKNEIARNEEKLEQEKQELTKLQEQETAKKQEIAKLVDATSQKLADARIQLEQARANKENYEAELEKQKAYEEQLEAQKAAEDGARMEEIRKQEEEMKQNAQNQVPIQADASDTALLAALIQCESGGESYEGKLAVGSVVINRVRSSYFPNTIAGVIYQNGQFSPVASGRFATVLAAGADSSCLQAAKEVLGGTITVNCLYFRRNTGIIDGLIIGNHVFY